MHHYSGRVARLRLVARLSEESIDLTRAPDRPHGGPTLPPGLVLALHKVAGEMQQRYASNRRNDRAAQLDTEPRDRVVRRTHRVTARRNMDVRTRQAPATSDTRLVKDARARRGGDWRSAHKERAIGPRAPRERNV